MKIFNPLAAAPDNPLTRAVKEGYSPLAFAAAFSLVSNLLYLALPLYTFHIYGGVMTSGSVATLLVISVGVIGAFVMSGVIDHYRAKVLINFGVLLDQRVSGHLFATMFAGSTRAAVQARSQAMRDLDTAADRWAWWDANAARIAAEHRLAQLLDVTPPPVEPLDVDDWLTFTN